MLVKAAHKHVDEIDPRMKKIIMRMILRTTRKTLSLMRMTMTKRKSPMRKTPMLQARMIKAKKVHLQHHCQMLRKEDKKKKWRK